jgi:hypothetical protein
MGKLHELAKAQGFFETAEGGEHGGNHEGNDGDD